MNSYSKTQPDRIAPRTILRHLPSRSVMRRMLRFNPLRKSTRSGMDRLIYGKGYRCRQKLLVSAKRLNNTLDLDQLAKAILRPAAKAVQATQVSLLLLHGNEFNSRFAERLVKGEPVIPVKLRKNSPVIKWLTAGNTHVSRELIATDPELNCLPDADRNTLGAADIELLLPIKTEGNLIGILALYRKHGGSAYTSEDTDLLAVANLFLNNGFRRLPVVRDGTLVGAIKRRDLLGALDRLMEKVPEHHAALLYLSALQSSPPGSLSPEDSIHD